MDNLESDFTQMHFEALLRETQTRRMVRQAGIIRPSLVERALPAFGDLLIRTGTRIKSHAYTRLTTEEAATPTFIIML